MTNKMYNPNVAGLHQPPIPTIQQAASRYQGEAGPLIDLSQAVPGYPPPPQLLDALGLAASDPGNQGYGSIEGVPALRKAYADDVNLKHGSNLTVNNIMITAGCNQAFVIAALAVAAPGESISLISPWYFNHKTSIEMLGIGTSVCQTNKNNGFLPDITAIESSINANVRAVVIISPNNPTGAVYPSKLIRQIYDLCVDKDVWLIMDETYRDFLPANQDKSHNLFDTSFENNLITISSFSKSYCIPGQRLGTVIAGEKTIGEMTKVMDNLQICPPLAAQLALSLCIPKLRDWRDSNRQIINDRADALRTTFKKLPDWKIESIGAYFAYVSNKTITKSSIELAEQLAREQGVITIPGAFFGPKQDKYLRVAFANVEADVIATLSTRLETRQLVV